MKKIIVSLFTLAAAFGFGGCAQSDVDDNSGFVTGGGHPLKIVGTATAEIALESDGDDSRATVQGPAENGKYKAVFSDNDELRVFELYKNQNYWYCEEVEATPVSSSSTTVRRNIYESTPQQCDYLLFYPATALKETKDVISEYGATPTVKLTVPTVQYPSAGAPDAAATILYAKALNVDAPGSNGSNTLDNQLQKNKFRPLTAYGRMTLRGLEDKAVSKVRVTVLGYRFPNGKSTTSHITGTYNSYQFNSEYNTDNASSVYYDPDATSGYNYVELEYPNDGLAVKKDKDETKGYTADVWFSIVSNMYLAGQEGVDKSASSFIVEVTYSDGSTVTKQFDTKGQTGDDGKPKFKFTNGYVTAFSANMTQTAGGGAEPENPTAFKKVTSVEEGKKYVITVSYNGQQYVMRNDGEVAGLSPNSDVANRCAVKLTALGSAGFTLDGDKLTTTNSANYTFLVNNTNVASDSFNKNQFFSTTKSDAFLKTYGNSIVILSGYAATYQWDGLNVGANCTSLYYSSGYSSNITNYYVYTDDGQTAKISSTAEQTVITIYGVDTDSNAGPDMTEPLLEEKLEIDKDTSSANQYHTGSTIDKLFDGIVNSQVSGDQGIYHSPYSSGDYGSSNGKTVFPVELTFGLKKVSDVYRMHYYTRVDTNGGNYCNGDPGVFDVLYQTADGTWHQAKEGTFGSASAYMYDFGKVRGSKEGYGTDGKGYYHEVDFSAAPLKGATAVKLVFYTGRDNGTDMFISGQEVMFYGAEATPENQLDIKYARANQAHNNSDSNSKVQYLIDGIIQATASAENDNNIYHSPWKSEQWYDANMTLQTGTVFPVELSFDIDKSDVVRLDYYTRLIKDDKVANGTPGKFDVLYRCEGDAADVYRALNPNYDAKKSNAELLATAQFDMGKQEHRPFSLRFPTVLRNVVEVKLVFYSGHTQEENEGYLSGVEVQLFGETK